MSRTPESPNRAPASSGPPLRAFAMVLISLAIVFAGLGFASLGGSDDETPAAAPATTSTTTAAAAASAPAATSRAGLAAAPPTTAGTSAPVSTPSVPDPPGVETSLDTTATSGNTSLGTTSARSTVRVFNNSNVAGLASQTATFLEDEGFTISETGNYSEGLLTQTAVYYGTSPGEQQTAQAVADALGVSAQPRFAGIQSAAPGVIVIVTSP